MGLLKDVRIADTLVHEYERMLTDGFYAEVTLTYDAAIAEEKHGRPFAIESLRAIQLSKSDVLVTLKKGRGQFTTAEWKDFLLRSIGLEPAAMSDRAKMVALLRMIPFVERNYNMVELGPRGTGKIHLFQQISPYSHLISGGKATVAKMFVNMSAASSPTTNAAAAVPGDIELPSHSTMRDSADSPNPRKGRIGIASTTAITVIH